MDLFILLDCLYRWDLLSVTGVLRLVWTHRLLFVTLFTQTPWWRYFRQCFERCAETTHSFPRRSHTWTGHLTALQNLSTWCWRGRDGGIWPKGRNSVAASTDNQPPTACQCRTDRTACPASSNCPHQLLFMRTAESKAIGPLNHKVPDIRAGLARVNVRYWVWLRFSIIWF